MQLKVVKKKTTGHNLQKMPRTAAILDYLNEDCLRHILKFIPVRRLFCLERTSRRWQEIILKYLSSLRFGIHSGPAMDSYQWPSGPLPKVDVWLSLWSFKNWSFKRWTKKLGASVVVANCSTMGQVKIVGEFCPRLEAVVFFGITDLVLQSFPYDNFKQLRYLGFFYCDELSDYSVYQYAGSNILETLEVSNPLSYFSGQCLRGIQAGILKTLILRNFTDFDYSCLLEAADCLTGLTKLVLERVSGACIDAYDYLIPLLEKTPKLEHLFLRYLGKYGNQELRVFEPVCRMRGLRYLNVEQRATDADLEAVSRCPDLTCLYLESCKAVSCRGLTALCRRAGARLTALALRDCELLTEDDVVACIAACPKLTELDLRRCHQLTRDMLPRALAARRDVRVPGKLYLYVPRASFQVTYSEDLGEIKIQGCG